VKPDTFEKMPSVLQKEYLVLHPKGSKLPKLTVKDKMNSTLKYLREYQRMNRIAVDCKLLFLYELEYKIWFPNYIYNISFLYLWYFYGKNPAFNLEVQHPWPRRHRGGG
jgi:hypothetical protein